MSDKDLAISIIDRIWKDNEDLRQRISELESEPDSSLSRDQFERYITGCFECNFQNGINHSLTRDPNGAYIDTVGHQSLPREFASVQMLWMCWKESRSMSEKVSKNLAMLLMRVIAVLGKTSPDSVVSAQALAYLKSHKLIPPMRCQFLDTGEIQD